MGTGMKLLRTVVREVERSAKAAARENARREREAERRARQLERERIRQEKEDQRMRVRLTKEQAKDEKEKIKRGLERENSAFESRRESRRKLRLQFLNKTHK